MDRTFQKFLRSGTDLSTLGIERSENINAYFCTPKGATIFGKAGVDGIHFCFIRGFGSMVFAVSPMNSAPDFVHPLAKDFADFLRLLLACGDAAALEQAWAWDKSQFEAFLRNTPPSRVRQRTISELADKMKLTPMERPWEYIKELQSSFDYSRIRYTEDYYDIDMNPKAELPVTEWKVYFDGNFFWHSGKSRAGTEIRVDRQFEWAGHQWIIPAAYSCGKGLVLDFCMRTPTEDIRGFMKKWDLSPENDPYFRLTQERQLQMDFENPLHLVFIPRLELNGEIIHTSHSASTVFNPCLPCGIASEREAKRIMEHYGLDASYGWVFFRAAFPWRGKRRTEIKSLSLTMKQQPCRVPGPHFRTHACGDSFSFCHPTNGTKYTLTVQELEKQTLSHDHVGSDRFLYPNRFTAMSYTLSPKPSDNISIRDCADNDKPMEITPMADRFAPTAKNDIACFEIIGGADGPTAILYGKSAHKNLRVACSALHFDATEDNIEWRVEFGIKQFEEVTVRLI